MASDAYTEPVPLPRGGIDLPVRLRPPEGFVAEDLSTWPQVQGRLEFVDGGLLYMPPSGDDQQDVASSVTGLLEGWASEHSGFVVGSNEAGMMLGGEVRAADVAVWRRQDASPRTGGLRRKAPVLAVEIAGRDEEEQSLRTKATWYLERGVAIVWLVLPRSREVVVLDGKDAARFGAGADLPASAVLPGLRVSVSRVFRQLDGS